MCGSFPYARARVVFPTHAYASFHRAHTRFEGTMSRQKAETEACARIMRPRFEKAS